VRTRLEILLGQVANLPTSLLLGSSALSTLLGDLLDAAAILAVVGLNSAIGYQVERKSEDLLASWRKLEAGRARVIRDGALRRISADDVVPGDVILVKAGDVCPADARVIDAHRLTCNEAPLTGESEPRGKTADAAASAVALAERTSMLYAGTVIAGGHGRAVVTATGARTELAAIGRLLEEAHAPGATLQDRLGELGNRFAMVGVAGAALSGAIGALRGRPLAQTLRNAVALGVGAIPEGLPVITTAALVRSMQRMRQRGIVVRRLASAETLGRVSVICADKTGTLTENSMSLEVLEIDGAPIGLDERRLAVDDVLRDPVATALAAAVLSSDVDVSRGGERSEIVGSSTEQALVRAAEAAGLDWAALRRRFPRRLLRERQDGRHFVVSVHDPRGRSPVAFVKGAPEQVIDLCTRDWNGPLDAAGRRRLRERNAALAAAGLRVLAVGWRPLSGKKADGHSRGYTLIGLVGLRDPVREGAAEAVRAAAHAGIRTLILTGDQHRTAESVARIVGLEGKAVDGGALLDRLTTGDATALDGVAVLSRITPADKLAIVRALQAQGHVVAMAGDGINDAPALKIADVGIAVGIRSSDLARQAADLVLENADLRSILSAVSEGRIVYDNLRTVVRYLFATNSAEMAVVIGSGVFGASASFTSRQLLWINLVSDIFPALALALEPGDPDVLDRPPVGRDDSLLSPDMQRQVVRDGLLLASAGTAGWLTGGRDQAFAALLGAELGYAAVCRRSAQPPSARFLLLTGSSIALQGLALSLPPLRYFLGLRARPNLGEILAFAGGLAVPVILSTTLRDGEVVRIGRAGAATARRATSAAPRKKIDRKKALRRRDSRRTAAENTAKNTARGGN
jgi:P-type Ca2+ transporter type 2C